MFEAPEELFAAWVEEALAAIPAPLRSLLGNVQISIEDEPSPHDYTVNEVPDDEDLFGLFEGVPITESGFESEVPLPNRIRIFRFPHEEVCDTEAELREEVRRTVHHEIAHHFGIDDDRLEEIGAY